MKILIDGQTLLTPEINRGIGKYFLNTVENVLENDFTNDFYLNSPTGPHLNVLSRWSREKLSLLENESYDIRINGNRAKRDNHYSNALNNDIDRHGIDLYWSPNGLMDNVVLPVRETKDCKYAVTIFDLIVAVMEEQFARQLPAASIALYKNKLRRLETDFDLFLHISAHTKSDFLKMLAVEGQGHVVTPLATGTSFRPYSFPHSTLAKNYVIYPGGFDPRKNMDRTVEAFAKLHKKYKNDETVRSTQLCIVCTYDNASKSQLLKLADRLGVQEKVWLTGYVNDSELVELYQKARCLFFPSLYEGFGLPLLEGLASGLPIAASNTSSIPEVGGEHAFYFDPQNVDEMADVLYSALGAPMDQESKLRRYEYSRGFTWQKTAQITLDAFTECVRNESPLPESAKIETTAVEQNIDLDFIDVRRRMKELSVEELCETAEQFYARLDSWEYLQSKPFSAVAETPELLISFAQVVQGLRLLPDMKIVDFGAGSCWTSRFLSQMGLKVIAVDVSSSALTIGRDLYARHPVVGDQPEAEFLRFDGHKLELPDESVDRISCWDAFHHVPNPAEVLKEMARVLKRGGIAGFSEPGPEHSKSPQSQYEMRTNRLIENDIDLTEIWFSAKAAGFTDIRVALFNPNPSLVPPGEFEAYLSGDDNGERYLSATRDEMQHRRLFFLFKGDQETPCDSRQREELAADLRVERVADHLNSSDHLRLHVVATNKGRAVWLPGNALFGSVRFGVHLFDAEQRLLDLDYFRKDLTTDDERAIMPGETIEFDADVPLPPPGIYTLQCDLVSERVCWFEHNGSPTVRLLVEVA